MAHDFDLAIIGAGIVGLATAFEYQCRNASARIIVIEKEEHPALHQTGRNSGVIHSGIYYKPGSLKALTCRAGKEKMETFCRTESLPFDICGKVVIATSPREVPALDMITARAQANGVACERISPARLAELEPHTAGIDALHVPETGIVDYTAVCARLLARLQERGAQWRPQTRFQSASVSADGTALSTTNGIITARRAVNAGGLHCDRIAQRCGYEPDWQIVPFRGEYFTLGAEAQKKVRNLIYPVPDPRFPFLGAHFTRMIGGGVECGPNAVLAFAREGYTRWTLRPRDLAETLLFPGFATFARAHWRMGLHEVWRSFSRRAFLRSLRKLVPAIALHDLQPAPAGVRAQAIAVGGQLVDDFLLRRQHAMLHVGNAPSPAATASFEIARHIVDAIAPPA